MNLALWKWRQEIQKVSHLLLHFKFEASLGYTSNVTNKQ